MPQHISPGIGRGRGRRDQVGDRASRRSWPCTSGPVQQAQVAQPPVSAPGSAWVADCRPMAAEIFAMAQRRVQHGAAADRAADHHRPVELKRTAHRHHRVDIEIGRELIGLALEARRRRGLAVPRQIEAITRKRRVMSGSFNSARYCRPSEPAVCRQTSGMPPPPLGRLPRSRSDAAGR